MKSVGLVTAWKDNYGSALQCFATKKYIENQQLHCDVLAEYNLGGQKYLHYLRRIVFLACHMVLPGNFYRHYIVSRENAKKCRNKISPESAQKILNFTKCELQVRRCSHKRLRQIGVSEDYAAFIAGSDQIWNAQEPANPICFLRFAPARKRIALAPSFGVQTVAKFNRGDFRRYLRSFRMLSAREEAGVGIIRDLTGRTVPRLADPTVLLMPEEWRSFCTDGIKVDRDYILVHFLDAPNEHALETIRKMQKVTGYEIIVFAYPHEELTADGDSFMDGAPFDYLSLIDHAQIVCTDSFHTSLFSIYFGRKFYTFARNYGAVQKQSSRLDTLLKLYHYQERMIEADDERTVEHLLSFREHDNTEIIAKERKKVQTYLEKALAETIPRNFQVQHPQLRDREECTGCGACVSACPTKAISMQPDFRYGFQLPQVDPEMCIQCGRCEKACFARLPDYSAEYEKKAWICHHADDGKRAHSASGGLFAACAEAVIETGGVVYGAVIHYSTDPIKISHTKAETLEELAPLLNSKYVQSDCSTIYGDVRKELKTGRKVLFCGTSCQIAGLLRYLGAEKYLNLYTMDLICHGVPGEKFFQDYVTDLERKYGGKVINFSFRRKPTEEECSKDLMKVMFQIHVVFEREESRKEVTIPMQESSYYQMFLNGDSYRESCYHCPYATINKPADLTAGDYYEAKEDYPSLFNGERADLRIQDGISCCVVHSVQGEMLLNLASDRLKLYSVDASKARFSHEQLCHPQTPTSLRKIYFDAYQKSGFPGIERIFRCRRMVYLLLKKILLAVKK